MIIEINADLSATVYDDSGKRGFRLPVYNPRTMAKFTSQDEVHECAMSFIGEDIMVDFEEADWHPSAHETVVEEAPAEEPAPAPVAE
jgi:hypothetical protein